MNRKATVLVAFGIGMVVAAVLIGGTLTRNGIDSLDATATTEAGRERHADRDTDVDRSAFGIASPRRLAGTAKGEIRFHSDDRRPGEDDISYRARLRTMRKYEEFRAHAGMTAEQEQSVLQILADVQIANELHDRETRNQLYANAKLYMNDPAAFEEFQEESAQMLRQRIDEGRARLAEVLTGAQMSLWSRHFSSPLMFAEWAPLDVAVPDVLPPSDARAIR